MSDKSSSSWTWEREAMNGKPMPDGLSLPDQMAYTAMRYLHRAFQKNMISKKQASVEKQMILKQYDSFVSQMAFDDRLTKYHVHITRETELAASECRKNPTPENAIRLCNIISGIERPLP